jgi:hypothetical protein
MASNELKLLLERPAESLNVEVKTWIDPASVEGKAKIVKGVFALRNRNGGNFIVGFNNKTLQRDPYNLSGDLAETYHLDAIQDLVSRYASVSFEIAVEHVDTAAGVHPVIVVPSGVRVPVVVKRDLAPPPGAKNPGKNLLSTGDLYIRTLEANGVPSSSIIGPNDYADLLEICFENREADIGRFLRRHLGRGELGGPLSFLFQPQLGLTEILRARCDALMKRGDEEAKRAFATAALERPSAASPDWLPEKPLTLSIAVCLDPPKDGETPSSDFLREIYKANPTYTGRPMWGDTRWKSEHARPKVIGDAWTTVEADFDPGFPHREFYLMSPTGQFYLRRLMQDDLRVGMVDPGTRLDETLMLYRVTEVFAVTLAMAKAAGWTSEGTAGFMFCWSGLAGRSLGQWAIRALWDTGGSGTAHSDDASSFVDVPLDTSPTALEPYVSRAVRPLFAMFDGYVVKPADVETAVRRVIERKIDS